MADRADSAPATTRVLDGPPHTLPMMLKAALPVLPGATLVPGVGKRGGDLPDLALTRHDVPVDRDHVAAYARVCGFPVKETLPLAYPHMLGFGLHLALMTDGSFPFPAMGLVHIENSLTQHRAIRPDEQLQVSVRAANLRPHAKGQAFDFLTSIHARGELVWESTSTYLRRARPEEGALVEPGLELEQVPAGGIEWKLPGDLGRRYAAVSGDHNPIHLYPLTAKALGFPRQIAHGMWSKARCVAALENRLPDAVRVEVAFKKPILLPGTVSFGARRSDEGHLFSLSDARKGSPHVLGRAVSLD